MMKKIVSTILVVFGFIFVGLGTVGMFVPVLPTVPFMLLAMICFTKGSKKVSNWFVTTKLYEKTLYNYKSGNGMTLKTKVSLLTSVTILIVFGFVMMKEVIIGRIIVVIVWICHIIYFGFRVKTVKEEELVNINENVKKSEELVDKE